MRIYCISSRGQTTRDGPPAGGWAWGKQSFTVKNKLVTKTSIEHRTWTDSLDKRPKLWNTDMRFGTWNIRSCIGRAP
jgi:hypothetical protein